MISRSYRDKGKNKKKEGKEKREEKRGRVSLRSFYLRVTYKLLAVSQTFSLVRANKSTADEK